MNKQQKIELLENELHTLENRILDLLIELQRKDNEINDLKSSIADYQEAVGDYQDELKRKDNNWNELKRHIKEDDDCWDIDSILFMMEKLENGNK